MLFCFVLFCSLRVLCVCFVWFGFVLLCLSAVVALAILLCVVCARDNCVDVLCDAIVFHCFVVNETVLHNRARRGLRERRRAGLLAIASRFFVCLCVCFFSFCLLLSLQFGYGLFVLAQWRVVAPPVCPGLVWWSCEIVRERDVWFVLGCCEIM